MLHTMTMLFTILAMTSAAPATLADGKAVLAKHSISFLAARKVGVAKLMSANPAALEKECEECVGHEENEIVLLKDLVKVEEEVIDLEKKVTEKKGKVNELKNLVKDEQEKKATACAKVKASGDKAAVVPTASAFQQKCESRGIPVNPGAYIQKVQADGYPSESDLDTPDYQSVWGNQQGLNDEDMNVITCMLGSLTNLQIQSNHIGDKGIKKFAEMIEMRGVVMFQSGGQDPAFKLQTLWLSGNPIGDEGIVAFADAVRKSEGAALENLKEITLGGDPNPISDVGMKAITSAIKSGQLKSLKNLYINDPSKDLQDYCESNNISLN